MQSEPIHPAVRVGHVHLRVADLDRSIAFYRDALGLNLTGRRARASASPRRSSPPATTTTTSASTRGRATAPTPPPPGHTGLYHVAFVYPDRHELGRAVQRLLDHGVVVDHGTDHGGTVSVYLDDPDGNGVELYYDRPRSEWFDADGRPVLKADRFDPADLLPTPTEG